MDHRSDYSRQRRLLSHPLTDEDATPAVCLIGRYPRRHDAYPAHNLAGAQLWGSAGNLVPKRWRATTKTSPTSCSSLGHHELRPRGRRVRRYRGRWPDHRIPRSAWGQCADRWGAAIAGRSRQQIGPVPARVGAAFACLAAANSTAVGTGGSLEEALNRAMAAVRPLE